MNNLNCCKVYLKENLKVIEIDVQKAKYQDKEWKDLSEFQKRKFENLIFFANNGRERIKIIYT